MNRPKMPVLACTDVWINIQSILHMNSWGQGHVRLKAKEWGVPRPQNSSNSKKDLKSQLTPKSRLHIQSLMGSQD